MEGPIRAILDRMAVGRAILNMEVSAKAVVDIYSCFRAIFGMSCPGNFSLRRFVEAYASPER